MAQAAVDEEFDRTTALILDRSTSLKEFEVRLWMKRVEAFQSNGTIQDRRRVSPALGWLHVAWQDRESRSVRAACSSASARNTGIRSEALASYAALLLWRRETRLCVETIIEALHCVDVRRAHCAGILVGALCTLGLTADAATVADELLTEPVIASEPPSINPAIGLSVLGRHHAAVESLANYILRVTHEARGARSAIEVLSEHRASVIPMVENRQHLAASWRYVEAYEAARKDLARHKPHDDTAPTENRNPEWVQVLRGRAAREVLSEEEQ